MSWYRRANFAGGYYFFTVVTYQRQQFLCDELARDCLRSAWQRVATDRPFESIALCLLPNHLHAVWRLPDDDADFSSRWKLIKMFFTHLYLQNNTRGPEGPPYNYSAKLATLLSTRQCTNIAPILLRFRGLRNRRQRCS